MRKYLILGVNHNGQDKDKILAEINCESLEPVEPGSSRYYVRTAQDGSIAGILHLADGSTVLRISQ